MATKESTPFFSIIIPTRDRPDLFQTALSSVLQQSFSDKEIIVIIDGSTESNLARYREIEKQHDEIAFFELENRPNGHGQSYAMNQGASKSSGKFLCFLDDDDHWTDDRYLEYLYENISAARQPVDMHYSNQKAIYADGTPQSNNVWIEDLISKVSISEKNHKDSYLVNVDFLLSSNGFAHLNCSVFARKFYSSIGGMDESIRYENDRDAYIRSIDVAKVILFSTRFISLHNIPDVAKKNNMSTVSSEIDKKLYQIRVFDKGISLSENRKLMCYCCRAKVYELKNITDILAKNREYRRAAYYAKEALLNGFNLRWLAYTVYLTFKSMLKPNNPSRDTSQ